MRTCAVGGVSSVFVLCSFILVSAEVMGGEAEEGDALLRPDVQALPWFGSSEPGDLSFCPLRDEPGFLTGCW